MGLKKLSVKELVDKLNSLELALEYNRAKGDEGSVSEINDKIYELRRELKSRN